MTVPALRDAVQAFRANDIATMLHAAGIQDVPKTKEGKVAAWVEQLADPLRISAALQRISPRCHKALVQLQMAGGEVRTTRYRALLARAGLIEKESRQRRPRGVWQQILPQDAPDPVTFEEVLAALIKHGLVMCHTLAASAQLNSKLGFEGGRYVYIPAEVALHLPPVADRVSTEPEITHELPGSARTCQRDLYLVWSAARETPLQLTTAELLRMGDLKRIAGQLLVGETITTGCKESDFRRIFFLRRLLAALGLLRPSAADAQVLEAATDPPFLAAEATRRVQACFRGWQDGAWWNELWVTYTQGQTRASGSVAEFAPREVVAARRKVLETLVMLARRAERRAPDISPWISLHDISDFLQDHDDEFLIDRETADEYHSYYGPEPASPYVTNSLGWVWEPYGTNIEAGWGAVEAAFIRGVLVEGLYWMGLVDLGYSHPVTASGGSAPAKPAAVRLTDMGRWLLLDGPRPVVPVESGRVVVQPNFHVFAFDPISDAVLSQLDRFAARLKAERAVEYEITRDSVYRAQLAGQTTSEIAAWLEQTTGMALPQNVARSLEEWQVAFQRITVRARVGWLQAASPQLLDALLMDAGLRPAITRRVSATSALVDADRMDELERALLAAGELPVRTQRAEDARHASITLAPDGAVGFAHAVPSLYVFSHLQRLAEQAGGSWRLSEASIKRAHAAGLTALEIIAELRRMALGGVPEALELQVKAWCKHYGDAGVLSLTLIQFRDQAALVELLTDGELARHLRPFRPEAGLGLAAVDQRDLNTVRALLAARGVELQELRG